MKVQMFVCAGLMLALTQALGCQRTATRSATASQPAATISRSVAPDPCVAALAPAAGDKARDAAISRAQLDARSPAHDRAALERLGYLYVARARVSNNPGDYTLAEKAAACLEARYPDEAAALLLRGHVLHQLHRFSEAEQIARALVARRTVVLDYGLLGDALMEQGRLSEAAAAYQKMLDLKPFYQSYTRAAHIRWLKGDLPGAIAAMRLAIDAASPRDPESLRLGVDTSRCLRAPGRTARRVVKGRGRGAATPARLRCGSPGTGTHLARVEAADGGNRATQPRGHSSIRFPSTNGRSPMRCASRDA